MKKQVWVVHNISDSSSRPYKISAESWVTSGEALDSIVETWPDEMNLSSSTVGSPHLTPSQTVSTPAENPIRAVVDEGIPLGLAHGKMQHRSI